MVVDGDLFSCCWLAGRLVDVETTRGSNLWVACILKHSGACDVKFIFWNHGGRFIVPHFIQAEVLTTTVDRLKWSVCDVSIDCCHIFT